MSRWTVESLPWDEFDASKVNPDLLAYAKAASLVEANGDRYIGYLQQLFPNDPEICDDIATWGMEETQHGQALRAWVEKADPGFKYEEAMKIYLRSFKFPDAPIRGSQAMELVSRCAIETGTNSFYTAMRDATDEPVFRELCRRIAGDEFRHYHLFHSYLEKRFAQNISRWSRLKMLLKRSMEVTDEELCYAYAAANLGKVVPENLPIYAQNYLDFIAHIFEARHLKTALGLMARASGFQLKGWSCQILAVGIHRFMRLNIALKRCSDQFRKLIGRARKPVLEYTVRS